MALLATTHSHRGTVFGIVLVCAGLLQLVLRRYEKNDNQTNIIRTLSRAYARHRTRSG
jgi:hypothetical protein